MSPVLTTETSGPTGVSCDQVLRVAHLDALKAYHDLRPYRISLELADDGWHVDYQLIDRRVNGGGPHYVIDAQTGTILKKRYEQ